MRYALLTAGIFLFMPIFGQDRYMDIISDELFREMEVLKQQSPPVYFIAYRIDKLEACNISADFGAITNIQQGETSFLTATVHVGDKQFDNTHILKGESDRVRKNFNIFPSDTNQLAIRQALWQATDEVYRSARSEYLAKKNKILVDDTIKSDDFVLSSPVTYYEPELNYKFSKEFIDSIADVVKEASHVFLKNKYITNGQVQFSFSVERKYYISSDSQRIVENSTIAQISINGSIRSPEGDNLDLIMQFHGFIPQELPDRSVILAESENLANKLEQLRNAPLAEPYTGPVILSPRASGVFFHEILGHRVEGHRMKDDTDAQTFKAKTGESILPSDFSVTFNPSIRYFHGLPMTGYYVYDDEGMKAEIVDVVKDGKLKKFLMSRIPIPGQPFSNGHGRAQYGNSPISRQSNLIVSTTKSYPEAELRKMLIKECKKQKKEYGYYIKDVQGGFTVNQRFMPNAFNVTPTEVYRIYVDGRPDELVRGVKLIGTPLAMFSGVAAAGDTYDVFNGKCGAQSGWVPVAATSPAIFVKKIETQKDTQKFSTGPILDPPNTIEEK